MPIEKEYSFGTDQSPWTLREPFDGRSQLIVYHFMFGPAHTAGCPVCSSAADTFNGAVPNLNGQPERHGVRPSHEGRDSTCLPHNSPGRGDYSERERTK